MRCPPCARHIRVAGDPSPTREIAEAHAGQIAMEFPADCGSRFTVTLSVPTHGGFTLADYEARMAALDAEIRLTEADVPVEAAEVVALLSNLPGLWHEATPDERRQLVAPLVERVYVDVVSKRLCGVVPVPALRALLEAGMKRTAGSSAALIAPSDSPVRGILELVETGENKTRH